MHGRSILETNDITGSAPGKHHMLAPRGNEHDAVDEDIVVLGLSDLWLADAVQSLGKGGREEFGHVLNDHRPRRRHRQPGKDNLKGLGSPGRSSHSHDLVCGTQLELLGARRLDRLGPLFRPGGE